MVRRQFPPLCRETGILTPSRAGTTFFGMLDYIIKHKPPIVVIENVLNAPWSEVIERFADAGYDAEWQRLDTKCALSFLRSIPQALNLFSPRRNFYIPHTRTRGCASLLYPPR